jgi:hypothetical protein
MRYGRGQLELVVHHEKRLTKDDREAIKLCQSMFTKDELRITYRLCHARETFPFLWVRTSPHKGLVRIKGFLELVEKVRANPVAQPT